MKKLPDNCIPYKQTPVFNEQTVPRGLLKAHQTKADTWGRIVVQKGRLIYRILEPKLEELVLDPATHGVIEPQVLHEVLPEGSVSFYVEFHRLEESKGQV